MILKQFCEIPKRVHQKRSEKRRIKHPQCLQKVQWTLHYFDENPKQWTSVIFLNTLLRRASASYLGLVPPPRASASFAQLGQKLPLRVARLAHKLLRNLHGSDRDSAEIPKWTSVIFSKDFCLAPSCLCLVRLPPALNQEFSYVHPYPSG